MPHPVPKPWLVQKYGGTSIGKLLTSITSTIIPSYLGTHNVAVVCSARSGTTKSAGTTSLLLEAIQLATSDEANTERLEEIISEIENEHLGALKTAVRTEAYMSPDVLRTELEIRKDCEWVRHTLKDAWQRGEMENEISDRILSIGEVLACRIVAASLNARGITSTVITLDTIVQEAHGHNIHLLTNTFKTSPTTFLSALAVPIASKLALLPPGTVPIITGFFGQMPNSLISSVGRGYTDLCAALTASALSATALQIWKEVDGIFTADPRKIKAARLLATVTSEEAAELTYYGSEVIHPLTMAQIDVAGIPLRLKNVMNPEGSGTMIFPSENARSSEGSDGEVEKGRGIEKALFMKKHGYYGPHSSRRRPTAVTSKSDICVLNIRSNGTSPPASFFARTALLLEKYDVAIDLISSSQQMLSLAICCPGSSPEGLRFEDAMQELGAVGSVAVMNGMSIVSVVGHKLRNMVGVAAEMFDALAKARVNIYLISQGASEISISFVVRAQDAVTAMEVVHANVMGLPLQREKENVFAKGPWLY
ncbi:aspartate kinase [Massarina eburnea CBS 473.64]|uniref:Aspartokinase n=1 Tax=Massarina eburnea CBS 473.64 TaxID=1395130 RepID=A0A6A6RQ69_9PLEO|nr:aspartate kinase [Massarina eburnea CBS 473.64]